MFFKHDFVHTRSTCIHAGLAHLRYKPMQFYCAALFACSSGLLQGLQPQALVQVSSSSLRVIVWFSFGFLLRSGLPVPPPRDLAAPPPRDWTERLLFGSAGHPSEAPAESPTLPTHLCSVSVRAWCVCFLRKSGGARSSHSHRRGYFYIQTGCQFLRGATAGG